MRMFLVSVGLLAATACTGDVAPGSDTEEDNIGWETGCVSVSPTSVDFGSLDVTAGETSMVDITVENLCTVTDLELFSGEVGGTGDFETAVLSTVVAPGDSTSFPVRFAPTADGEQSDTLTLTTLDSDTQTTEVALLGKGLAPRLVVDESLMLEADVGCEDAQTLTLANEGSMDLTVAAVALQDGTGDLSLDDSAFPVVLAAGESLAVDVGFTPLSDGAHQDYVIVESDDPEEPESSVLLEGTAAADATGSDTWTQADAVETDILFALDASCSLPDDREALRQAFPGFLEDLQDAGIDYRITATMEDDGCPTTSPAVIDDSLSEEEAVDIYHDQTYPGPSALTEQLLTILAEGISQTGTGDCNEGLAREGANLLLVPVSDEDDQSRASVTDYVDVMWDSKADPELLRVIAWTADPASSCGDGGTRYQEAVTATDGELVDICAETAETLLDRLVTAAGEARTRFVLSGEPLASTLVVTVDGSQTDAWSLDGQVLVFDTAPTAGAEIQADYYIGGTCD